MKDGVWVPKYKWIFVKGELGRVEEKWQIIKDWPSCKRGVKDYKSDEQEKAKDKQFLFYFFVKAEVKIYHDRYAIKKKMELTMQVLMNKKWFKICVMIFLISSVWLLLVGYYFRYHHNNIPDSSKASLQSLNNAIYPVSIVNICSKKLRVISSSAAVWPLAILGSSPKILSKGSKVGSFLLEELHFERLYSDENRHYGDFVLTVRHGNLFAKKRVPLLLTKLGDKYACMTELMPFKL